ncbi:hypothetical protein EV175_006548, partial [Coemansia sp. RSA 1933]
EETEPLPLKRRRRGIDMHNKGPKKKQARRKTLPARKSKKDDSDSEASDSDDSVQMLEKANSDSEALGANAVTSDSTPNNSEFRPISSA